MEELSRFFFTFWNSFCQAYQEGNIPTSAIFPYISYSVVRPEWGNRTILAVNIYDQSTSFTTIRGIGTAIAEAIPQSGVTFELENGKGAITMFRGNPFIQSRSLPADEVSQNIKTDYVSIELLGHIY